MNFILLFFVAQLINVVLSTIKSVITVKGGKLQASIINAVTYSFNIIVIKSLVDVDMMVAIMVTIFTNLFGVYLGLTILDKLRKDQLWKITTTLPTSNLKDFKHDLNALDISYIAYETSWDDYKVVDIFSKHKNDSRLIKTVFKKYDVKYTISANRGYL
ncbi:TPA: hypothetical protein GXZ34_01830 [bacterium]|nr:hypothetical protein [bacterium]